MLTGISLADAGIDAAALKPTEVPISEGARLDVDTVTIDYEGHEHVPDRSALSALAAEKSVRLTTPVRADGFDPLGDDSALADLPDAVGRVLVAGHDAYLTSTEAERAIAPRLRHAVSDAAEPWVGTEGIERLALAVGGTQFELLSRTTARDLRSLRTAGFDGEIAIYAPTVLSDDEDEILDAVGDYAARRGPVRSALPEGAGTDADARGRARDVLTQAVRDYALVGDVETVAERVQQLKDAGADTIVGYPARGIKPVR